MDSETFDIASLESFRADLVAAGFEPVTYTERRHWRGPIPAAFDGLTDARTMDVLIDPGWPYQPPRVFVNGLDTNHSMRNGFVCLWRDGDASRGWETVEGFLARVEDWCERAKGGWVEDDLPFDAYLNFHPKSRLMATFDFESLRTGIGSWGRMNAKLTGDPEVLRVERGPARQPEQLRGLWFRVARLKAPPPRELAELNRHLNRAQRRALKADLSKRRSSGILRPSGGTDLIMFAWERRGRTDLMIMACLGEGDDMKAMALAAEPDDEATLRMRAGPDAAIVKHRKVVIFGVGALGGHVAVTLAESGVATIRIVDGDLLAPGNVVRHVAGRSHTGGRKVDAVRSIIEEHAPWTEVEAVSPDINPRGPSEISQLIGDAELIVDATGEDSFVHSVARIAEDLNVPLVSGALYRGGFIGRVQRQALDDDGAIYSRPESSNYPAIPPARDPAADLATPSLGCSAPVNNAPPSTVLACASQISQVALDVLTARFELEDEVIDIYRPLPDPPFDRVGRYRRPC